MTQEQSVGPPQDGGNYTDRDGLKHPTQIARSELAMLAQSRTERRVSRQSNRAQNRRSVRPRCFSGPIAARGTSSRSGEPPGPSCPARPSEQRPTNRALEAVQLARFVAHGRPLRRASGPTSGSFLSTVTSLPSPLRNTYGSGGGLAGPTPRPIRHAKRRRRRSSSAGDTSISAGARDDSGAAAAAFLRRRRFLGDGGGTSTSATLCRGSGSASRSLNMR